MKERVVDLKRSERYSQANFSHFQELLEEHESIHLSKSSVYRILTSEGLSPKRYSRRTPHKRRKRKPRRGMLTVMDASPYRWFLNGMECSLHGVIDDAGGEVLNLHFSSGVFRRIL